LGSSFISKVATGFVSTTSIDAGSDFSASGVSDFEVNLFTNFLNKF